LVPVVGPVPSPQAIEYENVASLMPGSLNVALTVTGIPAAADWFAPALFLRPTELKSRAKRESWSEEKMRSYLDRVERLRTISKQYTGSQVDAEREMARIASLIVGKWDNSK
jgi:hypothetical protein